MKHQTPHLILNSSRRPSVVSVAECTHLVAKKRRHRPLTPPLRFLLMPSMRTHDHSTQHTHTHSMRERNSVEEEVSHWHTRFVLPHLILSSACRAPRRNRCSCTCTWGKPWREYTFSRTIDPPRRNLYIYIYIRHALPPLPPIISFPSIPILSHCSVSSCLERARKKVGHTHEHIYIYMSHSCVPSITQRVGFQHVWRGMLLRISSS